MKPEGAYAYFLLFFSFVLTPISYFLVNPDSDAASRAFVTPASSKFSFPPPGTRANSLFYFSQGFTRMYRNLFFFSSRDFFVIYECITSFPFLLGWMIHYFCRGCDLSSRGLCLPQTSFFFFFGT